jgi:hypothetical protein
MTNIDFFGCSFTEFLKYPYQPPKGIIDLELYSMHSHNTKTLSSFLEFDLAYNNNSNYVVNNYGKGSFGNFTICNVIENRVNKLDKTNDNIAIVQLSAILRSEHSWQSIKTANRYYDDKDIFDIDFERVKPDYIVEESSMDEFYEKHIDNINRIINTLKSNYNKFFIFFGWDVLTDEFYKFFESTELDKIIPLYPYKYRLKEFQYFENSDNYDYQLKTYVGKTGGMLEYSSNLIENEILRYVGGKVNDHHPSYFSNKIFYFDIIREFIKDNTNFDFSKNYLLEKDVIKFERFLETLLIKKSKGGEWEDYQYSELQKETIMYIRNNILNKII